MNIKSLFFLLLILLSACGKKSSSSNRREARITPVQIQEVMDNQDFECASLDGNCPAGITRLLILNRFEPDKSAVCTGFMVSPTRLVTNHHCVATATQCADTHLAIYNGAGYEQTICKSIIKTQQDVDDPNDPTRKIDFTVLEISDPYAGEFFNLSNSLASAGDLIQAWVIDHTGLDMFPQNLTDSRITEFSCSVADQNERASLVMMKCPIINGNSGSPALNAQGRVVGVIWGGNSSDIDSTYDLDLRRQLGALGLATEVNAFRDFVSK